MFKTILAILPFFSALPVQSQYDDLLRDPNVVWVAEYTADFFMNPVNERNSTSPQLNFFHVIQLRITPEDNGLMGRSQGQFFLNEQMFTYFDHLNFKVYRDAATQDLLKPADLKARFFSHDTSIDCATRLPVVHRHEIAPGDIGIFRVRQIIWYNAKRHRIGTRFLAYAPVIKEEDDTSILSDQQPMFWLKGKNKRTKRHGIHRFSFVFQTSTVENAPHIQDLKPLKGDFDIQKLIANEVVSPSQQWFNTAYQPIDRAGMSALCFGVDTIVQYNYENQRDEITLKPWNRIVEVDKIDLVQNWYYDKKRHQLFSRLVGWAPLSAVRHEDGDILYYMPLFYQIYR